MWSFFGFVLFSFEVKRGIWWSERKGVLTLFGSSRGKHLLVVWLFQSRWNVFLDSKKTPTVLCLAVKNLGANCWWESLFWSLSGEFDKVLGPFFLEGVFNDFDGCRNTLIFAVGFRVFDRIFRNVYTESSKMLTQNRQKFWHRIVKNVDTESHFA